MDILIPTITDHFSHPTRFHIHQFHSAIKRSFSMNNNSQQKFLSTPQSPSWTKYKSSTNDLRYQTTEEYTITFDSLPLEVKQLIFFFLDPRDLVENCCKVNKEWDQLSNNPVLWRALFEQNKGRWSVYQSASNVTPPTYVSHEKRGLALEIRLRSTRLYFRLYRHIALVLFVSLTDRTKKPKAKARWQHNLKYNSSIVQ
jgi:hypothetical protein